MRALPLYELNDAQKEALDKIDVRVLVLNFFNGKFEADTSRHVVGYTRSGRWLRCASWMSKTGWVSRGWGTMKDVRASEDLMNCWTETILDVRAALKLSELEDLGKRESPMVAAAFNYIWEQRPDQR